MFYTNSKSLPRKGKVDKVGKLTKLLKLYMATVQATSIPHAPEAWRIVWPDHSVREQTP